MGDPSPERAPGVRYLLAVQNRHQLLWTVTEGERLELHPDAVTGLPETATRAIGAAAIPDLVTANCIVSEAIGDDLGLYAYRVAGVAVPLPAPSVTVAAPKQSPPLSGELAPKTRDGARREILEAARKVMARGGSVTFTMSEVVAEMHARGTGYADSTIRTMLGSHLRADAAGEGVAGYTDVEWVSRGTYRLRR